MNICVIDEDCVIGRWYNLDFELMSLCPQFFFVCETSLSFFLCSLAVFVFMKFALLSTIARHFFCLFEMRQISEHIRLQMEPDIM